MASVAALPIASQRTTLNHQPWKKREFVTDDDANTTATMVGRGPGMPAAGFGPWKKVLSSVPHTNGWFKKDDYWKRGAHKEELPYKSGIYEISLQLPDGHAIGRTDRVVIYAGKALHTSGSSGLRKRILSDYGGSSGGGGNFPGKARQYIALPIPGFGPGGFHVYWRWMEIRGDNRAEIKINTEAAELRLLTAYDYALAAKDNPPQRPAVWRKVADTAGNHVGILAHLLAQSTDNTAAATAAVAAAAAQIAAVDDGVDEAPDENDDEDEAPGENNDEDEELDEAEQAAIDQITHLVVELNISDRTKRALRRRFAPAE
ncbi:hypothetical protein PR003_g27196 [Phytophthora rubi]|uniref:Uncharacterized protein n=1 Tax=Phytophthora rubi TaxID=129364 RepID=A0A6A3ID89_9STRA|nr:hypothetical protein PR002_g26180 [Phytophthora rubi]KAE8981049.1 hypothetical protein PR001_g24113 [Phytophthora rubi]KAE9283186.1 hypothetical protein PR003_g27196 [Phytophthora rubi]